MRLHLAGQKFCDCGQLTRRIIPPGQPAERVEVDKDNCIGGSGCAPGFTMLRQSHYAADGKCWRCNKPDYYFEVGKQS